MTMRIKKGKKKLLSLDWVDEEEEGVGRSQIKTNENVLC